MLVRWWVGLFDARRRILIFRWFSVFFTLRCYADYRRLIVLAEALKTLVVDDSFMCYDMDNCGFDVPRRSAGICQFVWDFGMSSVLAPYLVALVPQTGLVPVVRIV